MPCHLISSLKTNTPISWEPLFQQTHADAHTLFSQPIFSQFHFYQWAPLSLCCLSAHPPVLSIASGCVWWPVGWWQDVTVSQGSFFLPVITTNQSKGNAELLSGWKGENDPLKMSISLREKHCWFGNPNLTCLFPYWKFNTLFMATINSNLKYL